MFADNLIELRKLNHLSQEPGDRLLLLGDEQQGMALLKEEFFFQKNG